MCGIAGFWSSAPSSANIRNAPQILKAMSDAIAHRGPDDHGVWIDSDAGVGVSHRRLAVLELSSAGAQPMVSESGRFVLVFNGEIYNHQMLRKDLEGCGRAIKWRGHSDTETLLVAIEKWGLKKTLTLCIGMFALAVWDRRDRRLSLGRDRMGEKPLFYGWCGPNNTFVFGSELKSIKAFPEFSGTINRKALQLYFQFSVVPAPYSIYSDVFKVRPGCLLELDVRSLESRVVSELPYWELGSVIEETAREQFTSEPEALSALEAHLDDAIALQTIADVPVGAFLSGGVDSSLIVAMMQARLRRRVKTFTIGFHEAEFDEAVHARSVAQHLDTDHYELRVTPDDARMLIPSLPALYDEPFADSSQIPTMLVCRAAREKVTVALSGDGGDELFGGYDRYRSWPRYAESIGTVPRLLRVAADRAISFPAQYLRLAGRLHPMLDRVGLVAERAQRLAHRLSLVESCAALHECAVSEWPPSSNIVRSLDDNSPQFALTAAPEILSTLAERMMFWDAVAYLPDDILTKVDRASMGISLETRAPFLDHRVVATAWRMPTQMKIRDGVGKWPLRQLLYKRVPRNLIERPKAGFSVPIGAWLRGPLRKWAESLIRPERLRIEGYLDADMVADTWRQHVHGVRDHGARLWSVLMFQAWLESE